ncbi:29363_t:CDS:1, partial [Gigaspora margarita]
MVDKNGQISRKIPLIAQLTEEFNEQLLNGKIDTIRPLQTKLSKIVEDLL